MEIFVDNRIMKKYLNRYIIIKVVELVKNL